MKTDTLAPPRPVTTPLTAVAPPAPELPRLLDIEDLARLLHRSVTTIAADVSKHPDRLPPRLKLPGSRRVLWIERDVLDWIEAHRPRAG